MITLFSPEEYNKAKTKDLLKLKCKECNKEFFIEKHYITKLLNKTNKTGNLDFCSRTCKGLNSRTKKDVICTNCNKHFMKYENQIKKTINNFCSHSCSAIYNNKHKIKGTKISKLEKYIQTQLNILYPNLVILYNNKTAINSELDIFIPSLKLAFELNGIFHYEPIFGENKFTQIQKK